MTPRSSLDRSVRREEVIINDNFQMTTSLAKVSLDELEDEQSGFVLLEVVHSDSDLGDFLFLRDAIGNDFLLVLIA